MPALIITTQVPVSVALTNGAGTAVAVYSDAAMTSSVSQPLTVSSSSTVYVAAGPVRVVASDGASVALLDTVVAVPIAGSVTATVPAPSVPQLANLYAANSVLAATADNSPAPVTLAEGTLLGRATGGNVAALTPAEVATILSTPSSSTIGNLLTANQAGATDALSVTTGFRVYAGSGTLSSSTAWAANGSRSLALTTAGTGTESVSVSASTAMADRTPVLAGQTYTASAVAYTTAVGETVRIGISFYTSGGASSAGSASAVVTLTASAPASLSHTVVTPADAAYASVSLERISGAAGSVVYFDKVGLWVGAGGLWAMPGVPITNTGRRVTHPSTDDVLVEVWDSTQGRWQVAHYDTGRRSLTLANGWTATAATVRRVGYAVEVAFTGLNGASASSGTVVTLDSSLRPPYALTGQIGNTESTFPDKVVTVGTDGTVVVGGTYTNVTAGSLLVRMFTAAAVPTSLPGTLVSSAPYN